MAWAGEQEVLLCLPNIAGGALAIVILQTAGTRALDGRQLCEVSITVVPGEAVRAVMLLHMIREKAPAVSSPELRDDTTLA